MRVGVLASGAATIAYGTGFNDVWLSWFLSSFLGVVTVTPLVVIAEREIRLGLVTRRSLAELAEKQGIGEADVVWDLTAQPTAARSQP